MVRGERIPTAEEQWTLAKAVRRQVLKDAQGARKSRLHYESEDDEGEEIGNFEGYGDLDEELEGEMEEEEEPALAGKPSGGKAPAGKDAGKDGKDAKDAGKDKGGKDDDLDDGGKKKKK